MTNDRASAFVNYLHMVHPQRNGKTPSRLTVLKMANTASAVFNYGVKLGLCRGNPFRGLKDQPSHTIATAMEALRYDHGGVMTVPAVLFSQFLAMAERAQRKARRVAKLAHAKTAHRSSRVRATAKSKAIDLMAAIIREAHAHEARRLASLRARRRSK
jgi:hypothetical protein